MNHDAIDHDFRAWASVHGHSLQTSYRNAPVRSLEIRSPDHQRKVQIGVSDLTDTHVEVTVFDGKNRREKMRGRHDEVSRLLDAAEILAKGWLGPS
jgi:hypothetical protein